MIDTRIYRSATSVNDLCETFSTENKNLRQEETGIIYGSSVIDVIAGYNGDKPYSRYTYTETDEKDEPVPYEPSAEDCEAGENDA